MNENMLIKKYEQKWYVIGCLFETQNSDKSLEDVLSMRTFLELRICCVHITAQLERVTFI
jgi:hypothetical protein